MTPQSMRWIDSLLGAPLCLAASPWAWLYRRLRPPRALPEEPTILFIKLLGMGSIILTTPTIQAVRKRYPRAKLHLITFASNRALADNLGLFDAVLTLDTRNFWTFAAGCLRSVFGAWETSYDAVVDFEFFARFSALLSLATLAPRRVGFRSPLAWRGWLLTDGVLFNHYRHITENFMAQARALGVEGSVAKPLAPMRFSAAEENRVRDLLRQRGVPENAPFFVVNVNAGDMCLERRWPPAYYEQLISQLRRRYAAAWFVFMGSPGERAYVAEVLGRLNDRSRIADVSGALSLAEVAALLKLSRLLITSESGPLHFAQSVDVPSVSLFGPGPPTLFGPMTERHRTLYAAVDCSPCLNYYALTGPTCHGDNICMKYLTPAMVQSVVEELLKAYEPAL